MRTLIKNRSYVYFLTSILFASLSGSFSNIALSWSLLQIQPTIRLQARFMLCLFLPSIILSPFIGAFIDHFDSKKILIASRCIRLFGLTILTVYLPCAEEFIIYACSITFGISIAINKNAFPIVTKKLLKNENMQRGIALIDTTDEVANLVGLAASSIMIGLRGTIASIYFALFLISLSIFASYMLKISRSTTGSLIRHERPSVLKVLTNSLSLARDITLGKKLKYLCTLQAFFTAGIATFPILLPVFIATKSNGGDIIELGRLEALCALGCICGGICVLKFIKESNTEKIIPIGIFAFGTLIILFVINECRTLNYIIFTFIGFSIATYSLLTSRTQALIPIKIQGRAQSIFSAIETLLIITINLVFSFYSDGLVIKNVYMLYGLLMFIISILVKFVFMEEKAQGQ